ncbi:2-hydroxychromene-2-carboxylate isomerase [Paracraurococcus lichenis]|uniref:2-hydroxychromene-2-carboxylate isomerase n=1 Tax=Paracraurococcus lichenis TaxID=3064888 RepID=A0ABT9DU17_9PROT|nr:DsbA family protein [Paracraurococcus sp. LOR1-02]MDO9707395.1 DsbA family protein [Paracraurococcus sp. LOR1-02]
MTTPPAITWYFDTVSPFSWIALPAVEALAAKHAVTMQPVVLGAVLAHWGTVGPAELPPKRLHTYRLSQFLAARAGIPMRFPPRHPFRSLEVLRLLTALGATPAAVRTAFEFTWAAGRDASDPRELAALCGRLGVADYEALVAARGAREALRAATEAAIAAGVFGVPTLRIGTELFWGVDALPMAEAYLADPGLFSVGEMARLATLPVGAERKA